jgi:hypothetical protein
MASKERYMMRQAKMRGQRDLRTPNPGDANKPDSTGS